MAKKENISSTKLTSSTMLLLTDHEVKDLEGQKIVDAIAEKFGRPETVKDEDGADIANPQTKQEFYQEWVLKMSLEAAGGHIVATAAAEAARTKQAEIDATIKVELEVVKKP